MGAVAAGIAGAAQATRGASLARQAAATPSTIHRIMKRPPGHKLAANRPFG